MIVLAKANEGIKQLVWEAYLDGRQGAKKIRQYLKAKGVAEKEVEAVSERNIYRWTTEVKARYTEEQRALDEPFTLKPNLPEGVTREALPVLVDIMRRLFENPGSGGPNGLTVRVARWVSLLHPILASDDLDVVCNLALTYAHVERWAAIEGKEIGFKELDALVAFREWRSWQNKKAYRDAVNNGRAPKLEWRAYIALVASDPESVIKEEEARMGARCNALPVFVPGLETFKKRECDL